MVRRWAILAMVGFVGLRVAEDARPTEPPVAQMNPSPDPSPERRGLRPPDSVAPPLRLQGGG